MGIVNVILCVSSFFIFMMKFFSPYYYWVCKQIFHKQTYNSSNLSSNDQLKEEQTFDLPSNDQLKEEQTSNLPSNDQLKEQIIITSNSSNLPCISKQISNSNYDLPRIDQLREELLCPICLDICFKPSNIPCGHSFCGKCLRSALKRCGKNCPKCLQSIRDSRSLTVNTVLWNTIQLIFPKEIEARKVVQSQTSSSSTNTRNLIRPRNNRWR